MLIPSIDLMNGQAVQLRQGKTHVLTSETDPRQLITRFNRFGEVAVIDLDAALGKGNNLPLIRELCQLADVRVGGGIRSVSLGQELLRAGAKQLIIGTAATPEFLQQFAPHQVLVALDHRHGEIVDQGWTHGTGEALLDRAKRLAPYCAGFLCTFVETEGGLTGMDLPAVQQLMDQLPPAPHRLTVAGGVATTEEAAQLVRLGLDVQVGMALYTGKLDPVEVVLQTVAFDQSAYHNPHLIPTVVQDEAGDVVMMAYSSPESLREALTSGSGVYYSRSRKALWHKGQTSGHTQQLLKVRLDCDRDALLFTVKRHHVACHNQTYSCFGTTTQPQFGMAELFARLHQRREALQNQDESTMAGSYTVKMFQSREKLLRKLNEEVTEVTLAATMNQGQRQLVWEMADLLYFMSVLAVDENISWSQLKAELSGR
jgi:phosphoribosyl-AMP cyclohydrolase / phosphoribosyl-ATP pyrophosphohydrolase